MGIVRLKPSCVERAKAEKVNELLGMFNLPHVSTKGYESKPRPELTGGSASCTEAVGLHAVNELLRWTKVV